MAQVSVIIPVYNIERHLAQCLDSVAGQSLGDIEVICVDDGSTDGSPAILARYAARSARFRVVTQANAGPGEARNAGLALAGGEYVIFLDSDDWFEPDFLEKMVSRARETGADVTICRAVEFDDATGRELPSGWMLKTQYLPGELVFGPEDAADHLFQFTYGMPWDKLYSRAFLERTGIRFPALRNSEDLAFVFPTLLAAERIAVEDRVLIHHRVNRSASVSNSRAAQPEAPYEAFGMVRAYLEDRGLMERYRRSFLNWAMEFLVWHVSNMEDKAIQQAYFRRLRSCWLPSVGLERHPASYYYSRSAHAKYLLAKYAPYPVFRAAVHFYKYQKRLAADLKKKIDGERKWDSSKR